MRRVTAPTSPFQIRDFRRFWIARFCSVLATNGMVVIVGYQLYDVARGQYAMSIKQASFQLGLLGLAQFLPLMVLTPVAGVVADRFDRRRVAGLALALDLLVAVGFGVTTALGILTLPLLYALAALHGTARVFVAPAQSAIAPNIVPVELIPRAIALNSMSMQIGSVSGPALAGILFGFNRALPYGVSAVLLAIGSLLVMSLGKLPIVTLDSRRNPLQQIAEGFTFVWGDRFLLGCVTLDLFAVLVGGATALMPAYARDLLHVGPEGLGMMRAAPAVGAALVALVLSTRPIERQVGVKMLAAVAVYGVATIAFGLSRYFPLSLLFLVVLGGADMVSVFVRSSLIQLRTPDAMRGRVSAISGLAISASNELGEMQSGLAAALLGATGAVVFGGVGAILVTAAWTGLFPELPRTRTFAVKPASLEPTPAGA
jgi:MFS family permease